MCKQSCFRHDTNWPAKSDGDNVEIPVEIQGCQRLVWVFYIQTEEFKAESLLTNLY